MNWDKVKDAMSTWGTLVACVVPLFGGYFYIDGAYARQADVQRELLKMESVLTLLRSDVIEDRLARERGKDSPDASSIGRWESEKGRLEDRYRQITDQLISSRVL